MSRSPSPSPTVPFAVPATPDGHRSPARAPVGDERASARLGLVAEVLGGFVYDWDLAAGTVARPDGLLALLGFTPDEVPVELGWWTGRIHPDDLAGPIARGRAAFDDPAVERVEVEYRARCRDGSWRWLADRARLVRDAAGEVVRVVGVVTDATEERAAREAEGAARDEAERVGARLRAVAEIGERINRAPTVDAVLHEVVHGAQRALGADVVTLLLLDDDGAGLRVRAAAGLLDEVMGPDVRVPMGTGFAGRIAASGEPLVVDDARQLDPAGPELRGVACALVGVPLVGEGRVLGVLHAVERRPRAFAAGDVTLLELVGARAASALLRARLYDAERAARASIERLQQLSADLARVVTRDEVARVVVHHLVAALGALTGGVLELSPDGSELLLLGAARYEDDVRTRFTRYPVHAPLPTRDVVRTGEAVFLGGRAEWAARFDHAPAVPPEHADGAWAALPLVAEERLLGVLTVAAPGPRAFPPDERRFLQAYADLCAQALERARLYEAERAARERTERLQAVTTAIANALTAAEIARTVAEHGAAAFGALTAGVYAPAGDDRTLVLLGAVGFPDSVRAAFARVPLDASLPVADVARTGEPIFSPDRRTLAARYPALAGALAEVGREAWAGLPLRLGERSVGTLVFGFGTPRPFDADDRAFAASLAQQCAQGLERARLFEAEQQAAARAQRLQQLTARLNQATSPAQIADAVFEGALAAVGADAGAFALLHPGPDGSPAEFEIVRAAGYAPALGDRYRRFPIQEGRPLSETALHHRAVFVGTSEALRAEYPAMAEEITPFGFEAFAAVPVVAAERPLAALCFTFRAPQAFDEATRTFLATLGEQCALALERQRLHEAELRHAEQHAALLETIEDAFVAFDRELRFTYVNARAEALLGRPAGALLGRQYEEVFPESVGAPIHGAIVRTLASRQGTGVEALSPATQRWLEARVYPAPDGVSLVFQDVTARRRAQDAASFITEASRLLAASLDYEATLRAVAETAVPGLGDWCAVDMIVDPTAGAWPPQVERLAVVHQDPAMLTLGAELARRYPTDWSAEQGMAAVLRDATPLFLPEVTDAMVAARARDAEHLALLRAVRFSSIIVVPLVARERTLGALTLCMTESGRHYDEADLALARDLAQRAAVAVDNARLFREAERARTEAEAANRAKSQFLATMSHELRTPLNAIGGYAELLELGIRGPVTGEQREDLARIQRSQKHLLGLINEVLNYARLESGNVRYDLGPVGVTGALAAVESLILPQVRAKGLAFEVGACAPTLCVRADAEKVRQVLLNLLSNAVKFTDPGGRVVVGCRVRAGNERQRGVEITVADTGVGIAPDQLERVFEPFVQVGRTLSTPGEGTGLGLAISRDLARGMGGDLTAASAPGVGSTFTLVLPQG